MKLSKRITLVAVTLLLILVLVGNEAGKFLSQHFTGINNRLRSKELTSFDKVECSILYNSIIYLGGLAYPEAAVILQHYIYTQGQDLYLEPDYLQCSLVVQKQLQQMRTGETRIVRLKQAEDWRLSYAVNGFTLKKHKNSACIYQKIMFSKDKRVVTDLNFFLFKMRIPDRLIHVLHPAPFKVYSEWEL